MCPASYFARPEPSGYQRASATTTSSSSMWAASQSPSTSGPVYTSPWSSIASATLRNPAMLAPFT
jgi:hypothetical protein